MGVAARSVETSDVRHQPFVRFLAVLPWLGQVVFALLGLFFDDAPTLVRRHLRAFWVTLAVFVGVVFGAGAIAGAVEQATGRPWDLQIPWLAGVAWAVVSVVNVAAAATGRGPYYRD